jgi:hypothetical protein
MMSGPLKRENSLNQTFARRVFSDAILTSMNATELPELAEIEKFVREALPKGFHLESVDLTVGTLFEGQQLAFRERWSRDDFYVKIKFSEPVE